MKFYAFSFLCTFHAQDPESYLLEKFRLNVLLTLFMHVEIITTILIIITPSFKKNMFLKMPVRPVRPVKQIKEENKS